MGITKGAARKPRVRVSRRLREAVKLDDRPAYQIAWKAGVHPTLMSKLLHGAVRPKRSDRRVLAIAREVGVAAAVAFEPDNEP